MILKKVLLTFLYIQLKNDIIFGFFINNQICLYHYLCQNKLKNIVAVKHDPEESIVHNLENLEIKDDLEFGVDAVAIFNSSKFLTTFCLCKDYKNVEVVVCC